MKIELMAKGPPESITILRIIKGELKNWGYESAEIIEQTDAWGDRVFKLDVEPNDKT